MMQFDRGFARRLSTFLLITGCIAALAGCESRTVHDLPDYSKNYVEGHDPEADLEFAIQDATDSGRRILIFVGGDWCPWCRALDKFMYEDHPEVAEYLHEHFVLLKVYYGKGNYNRAFLSGFPRLVATPHFFVLDSDGTLLYSQQTEVLEKGRSYDKLKLMTFLRKWAPEES